MDLMKKNWINNSGKTFAILYFILSVSILWFAGHITYDLLSAKGYEYQAAEGSETLPEAVKKVPEKRNLSAYIEKLNRENIFGQPKIEKHDSIPMVSTNENLKHLLANYEIQGVIWGDNPKAIIFDKRANETITAGVKDSIGQMEIISISKGHITFQLLGETHDAKY